MQLEVGDARDPDERGEVVDHAVADVLLVPLAPDRRGAQPGGPVARAALLVEELAVDAVRVALQRERALAQVGQEHRRDPHVVVDDVPLREPRLRVEDLVEVPEQDPAPLHLDLDGPSRALTPASSSRAGGRSGPPRPRCGAARRWRARCARPRRLAPAPRRGEARGERVGEAHHLRRRASSAGGGSITSPAAFFSTSASTLLAVDVRVALRLERRRERLDELLRHLQLALGGLGGARHVERRDRDDLVGAVHRRDGERVLDGPDAAERLARAEDERRDRDLARSGASRRARSR